ncbi:hypothetical protein CALVIDRAFT_559439 [Calocera viscosa TUFC12733]|uniref:Uncharacterized protein n=1 Tax=Calocera viscosa (strain TUFC12733) TaxID=1330018 RepID=A0A167S720_CALVF|nr:hypothetical protein CALVIDRAFT_559439 [Calocera viscosa TUFC12733]
MTSDVRNHLKRMGSAELLKMVQLAKKAKANGEWNSESESEDELALDPSLKAQQPSIVRTSLAPRDAPLNSPTVPECLPLPSTQSNDDRWEIVAAQHAEVVQDNADLRRRLLCLEQWKAALEEHLGKKTKIAAKPNCPSSLPDSELKPKELAVSRLVRDLMRTQMYDSVGYIAGKQMPGPGRPALPREDSEKAYFVADWEGTKGSRPNQQLIQHAVRLVRQAHLDLRLERSEKPASGQDDFNKLPADGEESDTEPEEPPLIEPRYQVAWLSTENLMYVGGKIWNSMKQVWTNQSSEASQMRAAYWGSNARRAQRRLARADRLQDGAKDFAKANGIRDIERFSKQMLHMDWMGDLDSCDEDGERNDEWWACITEKAGLTPEQREDRQLPLWEWKRPAWMKEGIWQLYATFNHLRWVGNRAHPISTPSIDLGRESHRRPNPKAPKPWAFMVKEAYLAAHHDFQVCQSIPDDLTEEMMCELGRTNNRFIHEKCLSQV